MSKADGAIFLLALLVCLSALLWRPAEAGARYLVISQNGATVERLLLSSSASHTLTFGHNVLAVQGYNVRMLRADCSDQDCMREGTISRSGQAIVCLPERFCARIEAMGATVDDVAR